MAKILVSACLVGCSCRYQGDHCRCEAVLALGEKHTLIPVCPEQLGGLATPREPSEIQKDGRIQMKGGKDVSVAYARGARTALEIARLSRADFAVLKANSPSCGKGIIYDGSFSGKKCPGNGVTAALFLENKIPVYTENELEQLPL